MTVPQLLASLAILCFFYAGAAYHHGLTATTPPVFRDALLAMARTASVAEAAA